MTTEFKNKKIKFSRTPGGIPVLWEKTKKFDEITRTTILFSETGDRKDPIFNRIGSHDSLVPIKDNDIILKVFFETNGVGISILRILNIDKYSKFADVEIIKRKPPTDDNWIDNEKTNKLDKFVWEKVENVLNKLLS